jgi:hypothetical protein
MRAFGEIHTTEKTSRLILFIRHLPQITPEELNQMKGLNRKPQRIKRISEGRGLIYGPAWTGNTDYTV